MECPSQPLQPPEPTWDKAKANQAKKPNYPLRNSLTPASQRLNMLLPFQTQIINPNLQTYCVDRQVADSACSATAYLCGIKANEGTIGVTAAVPLGHCELSQNGTNHVHSIARWFQLVGKRTGVVTTTRITHASPAGKFIPQYTKLPTPVIRFFLKKSIKLKS